MTHPWHAGPDALKQHGFVGFQTIANLRATSLQTVPGNRGDMGVYVLLRTSAVAPTFLQVSTGGHFKGRDPTVSLEELQANWVAESPVVYVGKAGAPGRAATLRSRLKQYLAFGAGRRVGHWGGRLIWQLADAEQLVVAWRRTPDALPRDVEKDMIIEFTEAFGKRPFANLVG